MFICIYIYFFFQLLFNNKIFSEKALNYFTSVANENIAKRRKEKIVRPDMIHLLLEAQANKGDSGGNKTIC